MAKPLAAKYVKASRRHHAKWEAQREAEGWEFHDQYDGATLPLVPGRRFRVRGKPGWFRFRQFVVSPHEGELVDCYGPFTQSGVAKKGCALRVFKADRIVKVARRVIHEHDKRVKAITARRKKAA
jgi:hypothetical protein